VSRALVTIMRRSTRPSTLHRTVNEYQPKGDDALRLGSKDMTYFTFFGPGHKHIPETPDAWVVKFCIKVDYIKY